MTAIDYLADALNQLLRDGGHPPATGHHLFHRSYTKMCLANETASFSFCQFFDSGILLFPTSCGIAIVKSRTYPAQRHKIRSGHPFGGIDEFLKIFHYPTNRHLCGTIVRSYEVGGWENVPGIPGACATRKFRYLVRGP